MEADQHNPPEITLQNVSFLTDGQIDKHADEMAGDMRFFAIIYVIYGALISLTIVGAIIGIPMIIYHLKLNQSAVSFRKFAKSKDFFHLNKALENQRKFFFFYKVLIIVMLVLMVIYFIVIAYLFSLGMMSMPQDFA